MGLITCRDRLTYCCTEIPAAGLSRHACFDTYADGIFSDNCLLRSQKHNFFLGYMTVSVVTRVCSFFFVERWSHRFAKGLSDDLPLVDDLMFA